nr:hypothetical protein [Streptomyces sp. S10(2018)]
MLALAVRGLRRRALHGFSLDEQSGRVAASRVLGRVRDGFVVPPAPLTVGGIEVVPALVGAGLGIGGYAARLAAR